MTCPAETTHQYNLDLFTDPRGGQARPEGQFTFCLVISGNTITGVVDELSVPVTGRRQELGGTGVERITLSFLWAPSVITVKGFAFEESGGRREFLGRFLASAPDERLTPEEPSEEKREKRFRPPTGPDTGETGTATGQQT